MNLRKRIHIPPEMRAQVFKWPCTAAGASIPSIKINYNEEEANPPHTSGVDAWSQWKLYPVRLGSSLPPAMSHWGNLDFTLCVTDMRGGNVGF